MTYAAMLDKLATVYTSGATGAFTVVARTDLPCRLSLIGAGAARSASDRAELLATRQFFWSVDYEMPEHCQVEVAGQRWNPVHGTEVAPTHPRTRAVLCRACDVVRAE